MDNVKLVVPEEVKEQILQEYLKDWGNEKIVPFATNFRGKNYAEWLKQNIEMRSSKTCPAHLVPALSFFMIDAKGGVLGAIDIRSKLNDALRLSGGHIGYGIRPSERKKGFGKTLLSLGLQMCKTLGMDRILVVCNKENAASRSVILFNGGVLENEVEVDGEVMQRYWIQL